MMNIPSDKNIENAPSAEDFDDDRALLAAQLRPSFNRKENIEPGKFNYFGLALDSMTRYENSLDREFFKLLRKYEAHIRKDKSP